MPGSSIIFTGADGQDIPLQTNRLYLLPLTIFTALAVLYGEPVLATDVAAMDTVVVTGTRSSKTLLDVPVRTEVISRKTIDKQHARDLAEALRQVPGLVLKKIHGKSGYQVFMQGFNGDRVSILIDGVPLPASTGSTVDLTQIGTANIKQIEIVKGATSALYGSSAMGGVINIITEQPRSGDSGWALTTDVGGYGEHSVDSSAGVQHVRAGYRRQGDVFGVQLNADMRYTQGYDLDTSTYAQDGDEGSKVNLDARLDYRMSRGEMYFSPSYYNEDLKRPFSQADPQRTPMEKGEQASRVGAVIGGRWSTDSGDDLGWSLQHYRFDDETSQDAILTSYLDQQRTAQINMSELNAQWASSLNDDHLFTSGVRLASEELSQQQVQVGSSSSVHTNEIEPGADRHAIELFMQDDVFIGDHWELLPGFRVQEDSDFGHHAAPKINLMYSRGRTNGAVLNYRLGYGHGYRVPNLKERFYLFDHSALGYMVIGNPDLQPETSRSIQAGFEYVNSGNHRFDINLFHNDTENLIDSLINPSLSSPGLTIYNYQNIEKARTYGTELTVNYWYESAELQLGYTRLQSEDRATGLPLPERPEHQIKATLILNHLISNGAFIINALAESEAYPQPELYPQRVSAGWTQWDIKYNHKLKPHLRFFVGVENMFDVHKTSGDELDLRPESGRFWFLGLTLESE